MTDNTAIHPLARPREKSGKIRFISELDGKEHCFYTCINDLSGSRLTAFDNNPPSINDSSKWIKSVFRDIKARAEVVECIGDF